MFSVDFVMAEEEQKELAESIEEEALRLEQENIPYDVGRWIVHLLSAGYNISVTVTRE